MFPAFISACEKVSPTFIKKSFFNNDASDGNFVIVKMIADGGVSSSSTKRAFAVMKTFCCSPTNRYGSEVMKGLGGGGLGGGGLGGGRGGGGLGGGG